MHILRGGSEQSLGERVDIRCENVFTMVAPNPLNQPEIPSLLKIFMRTDSIDRSLCLADDGVACIRVLALAGA